MTTIVMRIMAVRVKKVVVEVKIVNLMKTKTTILKMMNNDDS
jgi:hypothetical protein